MNNRTIIGVLFALITAVAAIAPAFAQYYVNPYRHAYYNNYAYRGYAPYGAYGYYPRNHAVRNVAIGAGIGAAIGLLASHHGHGYW